MLDVMGRGCGMWERGFWSAEMSVRCVGKEGK